MVVSSVYQRKSIEDYKAEVDTSFVRDFGERVTVDGIRKYIERSILPKHVDCKEIEIGDTKTPYRICYSEHTPYLAVDSGVINQEDAFYWNLFQLWDAVYSVEEKIYIEKERLLDKKTKLFGLLQKVGDPELIKKVYVNIGFTNKEIEELNEKEKEVDKQKEKAFILSLCGDIKEYGYDYLNESEEMDREYRDKVCKEDSGSELCYELNLKLKAYQTAKKQCSPDMGYAEMFRKIY